MPNYKVVNADQLDTDLSAVADVIREQTGKAGTILFPADYISAPAELVEVGKQKGLNEFMDSFLDNGNRTNFEKAYCGYGWTNATFKPNHGMRPTEAGEMFFRSQITGSLPDILQELEVVLDFSNCTNANGIFQNARFSRLGVLDYSKCPSLGNAFAYCGLLVTIDLLIVAETTAYSNNTFAGCWALKYFTIGGTIANTISFAQASVIDVESAKSVITHLKNFTGTGNENTKTVSFHANTWAKLDAEGNASPNGNTWREYVVSDLRWNI